MKKANWNMCVRNVLLTVSDSFFRITFYYRFNTTDDFLRIPASILYEKKIPNLNFTKSKKMYSEKYRSNFLEDQFQLIFLTFNCRIRYTHSWMYSKEPEITDNYRMNEMNIEQYSAKLLYNTDSEYWARGLHLIKPSDIICLDWSVRFCRSPLWRYRKQRYLKMENK